ncbi:hypothetical protein AUP68_15299 [Ilyonectria robusta]
MLCSECTNIDFRLEIPKYPDTLFCVLHQTRQSFETSLATRCHLCLLVRGNLNDVESHNDVCEVLKAHIVLSVYWKRRATRHAFSLGQNISSVTVISRRGTSALDLIEPLPDSYSFDDAGSLPPEINPQAPVVTVHTKTRQSKRRRVDKPVSQVTLSDSSKARDNDSFTGSSANLELAHFWLRQCLDQHSHCKINHPTGTKTPLPTRLINIDQFDNPFLEDTNAQTKGPYIVLSYAWGDGKRVLTTRSNYQDHKQGLPVQTLPQTFADAIKVARGLNYRYIWIDAFCIIQDDKQDLARELPKMGDIYRYAVLTIYGEGAQSAHTGLFVNRDPYMYRPCKVSISISTESASLQKEATLATTCNGPDYLSPRGWILQERILSSRCLMFGKQMSWICSMGEAQETRPVPRPMPPPVQGSNSWISERLRLSFYTAIAANKSSRDIRSLSKQFDIWYVMVESYSDKELSFISDNLNAVSGLAALFHQAHNVTYAVGLWKEDIAFGLAWYVRLNDKRPVSEKEDGPSWSWASVGKVRIKFRSCARISSPAPQVLVEVIDITYDTISTLNPYGSVSKGVLHLRAPLKKAILRYSDAFIAERSEISYGRAGPGLHPIDVREQPRYAALLLHPDTSSPVAEAALDRHPSGLAVGFGTTSSSSIDVWCVLLHVQRDRDGLYGTVIVLRASKTDASMFQRLGLGFLGDRGLSWFGVQHEKGTLNRGRSLQSLVKEEVQVM